MIEELEKTESQWKNLPTASRNRALIKKWKDQAQVNFTPMQIVSGTLKFRENRVFRVISLISEYEISWKKLKYNDSNELTH